MEKTSSRGNSYFGVRHIKAVRCDRTKETKGTGITKENEKVKGIYPPIEIKDIRKRALTQFGLHNP